VTHEFWALGSEKGERRGVGLAANPLVIEDHNGVEGAVEDGLELAFARLQNARGFAVCPAD
jgi:hypothetical protein